MLGKVRAEISRINFALGRNPIVLRCENDEYRKYIPESYKAVLLLSADFELAWAWRYAKGFSGPYAETISRARTARNNIPKILNLCDKYRIPITWATVGHLFLDGCSKNGHLAHSHLQRIPYHENEYWKFDRGDWFDDDPCSDWKTSPEWYAPDLIRMIQASKVEHEVACHTFSHIDCRDRICSPNILRGEIGECQRLTGNYGIKIVSFVHPGHTIGNLKTLYELGFKSFRTDYVNALGYPQKHKSGLWELKSTMEFVYRREWSIDYHIYRYIEIVDRAIANKRLCLLWFHPSIYPPFVDEIMPRVFSYIDAKRQIIWITTVRDYVSWLDKAIND